MTPEPRQAAVRERGTVQDSALVADANSQLPLRGPIEVMPHLAFPLGKSDHRCTRLIKLLILGLTFRADQKAYAVVAVLAR
jgi:hypothetical protein